MEVPELNLRDCQSVFVRDEFYENIQAPKFHDFCSNEDPVVDTDGYFRRLSGRSPRPSMDPFTDQNAVKGTKESAALKPPGLPKVPLSSMTLNTDVTSSVPKSSSAGLKKAKPAVPMLVAPLTKSQDKFPSKNKMYQRVSPVSNASLPSSASDSKGNDPVQAPSTIKSYGDSENTDPNGTSQARGKVIDSGGSMSDGGTTISITAGPGSVQALVPTEGNSGVASESEFLVNSQSLIPRPSKRKSELTTRKVTDPAVVEVSDVKDRKRKPTLRSTEAGATRVYETRNRVLKQQRKSSTSSDPDGCPEVSDLGPSSSQSARTSCSEALRTSTVKPPADRRSSRRSSDNSRRKRASGGPNVKQGRRALMTGPKSNVIEPQGTTGNVAVQLSLSSPMPLGSNPRNKQCSVTEKPKFVLEGDLLPTLTSIPALVSLGGFVTTTSSVHATEDGSIKDECSLNPSSDRSSNSEESGRTEDLARESVQTLRCIPDVVIVNNEEEVHPEGDYVLEKLQKLHLQQEDNQALQEPECNNQPEAGQTSCSISSDDLSVVEEVNNVRGAESICSQELGEDILPVNKSRTLGGIFVRTGLHAAGAESCLDASDEFTKVVPSDCGEDYDTTANVRIHDIDLPVQHTTSTVCQATSASGEHMEAEVDQADVIESLRNLQIQTNELGRPGSKLLLDGDAGGVISCDSSLIVEEKETADKRGVDNEMSKSCKRNPPVDYETGASFTQERRIGYESRLPKRLPPNGPSEEAHCGRSDISGSHGPHFFMSDQQKRNNKRKSIELGPLRSEQRLLTTSAPTHNVDEQHKVTSHSSIAPLTHSQLSSSASRVAVSSGICGQHKKMKTTCPQPFRLRTEERGALKEVEFNKKVELYLAAKEKIQSVPFQSTTNKDSRVLNQNTVKRPRNPSKDTKTSVKQIHQHTQARAAERALFDLKVTEKSIRADEEKQEKEKRLQREVEVETKRMRKQMVPHAQRMPFFDRPFKPHRSTKTLTVPNSPKFHSLKAKKTFARTSTQE